MHIEIPIGWEYKQSSSRQEKHSVGKRSLALIPQTVSVKKERERASLETSKGMDWLRNFVQTRYFEILNHGSV